MINFKTARPVKGYEARYLVDENGNVYSFASQRELTQRYNADGYKTVSLYSDGKIKQRGVHRIVAEAFIENPNNYPIINHKDEDKANNNVNNLEWCTYRYNICYKDANKRRSETMKGRPALNRKGVYARKVGDSEWTYYSSIDSAKKATGIANYHVTAVCQGKEKQTKGYEFRYAEPSEVTEIGEC